MVRSPQLQHKMKFNIFFLVLLFSLQIVIGQSRLPKYPTHGISVSYYGNLLARGGAKVGYEFPIWEDINRRKTGKTISKAIVSKTNLGFFAHKRHHTALFLNSTVGYRFTSNIGFIVEPLHLGTGYVFNFLGGTSYQVDDNGNVKEKKVAGNSTFMLPYVSLISVGFDGRKKKLFPANFYLGADAYLDYPVNTKTKLNLIIPFGFTYYFFLQSEK